MTGLSLKQFRDLISDELGDDDPQDTANYDKYLNLAAAEAWYFAAWPERRDRDFYALLAPYATGTVTFTNGSDDVVGVGTTWTTAAHGAPGKIAAGYSDPWYTIRTVTDNTNIILEEPFAGTTAAGSSYVIYHDLVKLDPRVATISRVRLHDTSRSYELPITHGNLTSGAGAYPTSTGRPEWASLDTNVAGERTLRVGPYAPDEAYRVEYEYLRHYIPMQEDGDTHGLGQRLDDTILLGALAHAYRRDHFQRSRVMKGDFRAGLRREWGTAAEASPMIFQLGSRGPVGNNDHPAGWPVNINSAEI